MDVVLYTREEFRTHQGAALARMVAGLYSDGAIRINDAAELTQQTKATLVHEYVHAVVDDLVRPPRAASASPSGSTRASPSTWSGATWAATSRPTPWPPACAAAAQAGQLPRLSEMAGQALIQQRDPGLAYATSAVAVRRAAERRRARPAARAHPRGGPGHALRGGPPAALRPERARSWRRPSRPLSRGGNGRAESTSAKFTPPLSPLHSPTEIFCFGAAAGALRPRVRSEVTDVRHACGDEGVSLPGREADAGESFPRGGGSLERAAGAPG